MMDSIENVKELICWNLGKFFGTSKISVPAIFLNPVQALQMS